LNRVGGLRRFGSLIFVVVEWWRRRSKAFFRLEKRREQCEPSGGAEKQDQGDNSLAALHGSRTILCFVFITLDSFPTQ
jgi:hypothetical protein